MSEITTALMTCDLGPIKAKQVVAVLRGMHHA